MPKITMPPSDQATAKILFVALLAAADGKCSCDACKALRSAAGELRAALTR